MYLPAIIGFGGLLWYTVSRGEMAKCTNCSARVGIKLIAHIPKEKHRESLAKTLNQNNIACQRCGVTAWIAE